MATSKAQRAKTADRRARAIDMRIAGATWQTIADTLDYSDKAAAYKDVKRAMETHLAEVQEGAEELRTIESERLERLQEAIWPAALEGDPKAIETALKITDRRMRLLGIALEKPETNTGPTVDVAALVTQLITGHGDRA